MYERFLRKYHVAYQIHANFFIFMSEFFILIKIHILLHIFYNFVFEYNLPYIATLELIQYYYVSLNVFKLQCLNQETFHRIK